jgi:SAM-dependent methyltransferase
MVVKNGIIKVLVSSALKPFVIIWFWFYRWFRHNRMLSGLGNRKIGHPSIAYLPFAYLNRLLFFINDVWTASFTKYALKKYIVFLKRHYAKEGLGYFDYEHLSDGDRLKIYQEQEGRIAYYIKHNPTVLDYKDGDSFLDVGCGIGQNIKELVGRYPNSSIKGFDVSKEALMVIQTALRDNKRISVEVGDVVDLKYLASYPSGSFDHVVMSHVLAFLIEAGTEETRKMRQAIIDQLVRITSKDLLIMDGNILSKNDTLQVMIEQNNRCFFKESLVPYFSKHLSRGEAYGVFSPDNEGIIFRLISQK